jgi:hypothetical protein
MPNSLTSAEPKADAAMPFVLEVPRRLSECRVVYCILRNYHSLLHGLAGSSLDLLVDPRHLEATLRLLCEAAHCHGGGSSVAIAPKRPSHPSVGEPPGGGGVCKQTFLRT